MFFSIYIYLYTYISLFICINTNPQIMSTLIFYRCFIQTRTPRLHPLPRLPGCVAVFFSAREPKEVGRALHIGSLVSGMCLPVFRNGKLESPGRWESCCMKNLFILRYKWGFRAKKKINLALIYIYIYIFIYLFIYLRENRIRNACMCRFILLHIYIYVYLHKHRTNTSIYTLQDPTWLAMYFPQ